MLLDPFEEQLDLPAVAVKFRDRERGQGEIVGKKDQRPVLLLIPVFDSSQGIGVAVNCLDAGKPNGLVADQPCRSVHRTGIQPVPLGVGFGPDDKERAVLMHEMESGKIEIGAIHDIEGAGFGNQDVEDVDIVQLSIGNVHECGDMATQVQQGMEFDRRLGLAERNPGKQVQAQMVEESRA